MRSLWQLIFRYHVFILFLGLQTVALFLLVRNNNFHRATALHSANRITGELYARRTEVAEYLKLETINEQLAKENAQLKSSAPQAFVKLSDQLYLYEDTLMLQQYEFLPARVVNNSVNRVNNFITLDKGERHGVEPEMGVVSNNKVVGIVKDVSEHFCSVMPLINTNLSVSAKLKRGGAFGRVIWDGSDPVMSSMVEVPRYANPLKGDSIVATGYSSYFPEGVLIGVVENYRIPEGENFYEIELRLATAFHELSYVEIVNNFLSKEQQALEAEINQGQDD